MTGLRAHYFQHVPFEGLGSIERWLADKGYSIGVTCFFEDDHQLPAIDEPDLLIVMGGPMSVNDEEPYPWLVAEKRFIRDFIATGKPVIGICLGAQLIASAHGAKVYPNRETEIGWFPIFGEASADPDCFKFPGEIDVFHWHGDTFDLLPGATLLASSHGCDNQAFQLGDNVIGMQFHLETTANSAQALVKHCGGEITPGHYIQSSGQILFAREESYRAINRLMVEILDYVTR